RNPAFAAAYGTIGQLDDAGRANYDGLLLSAQRRLRGGFSVLSNYTLSKCMSDPATTELTGPTITDPTNPDLDYSYCDSDRRHVQHAQTERIRRAVAPPERPRRQSELQVRRAHVPVPLGSVQRAEQGKLQ